MKTTTKLKILEVVVSILGAGTCAVLGLMREKAEKNEEKKLIEVHFKDVPPQD